MKYLVIRGFASYGKYLVKGSIVDESEIRSVRLRQSEKKIIPAVSSFEVPVEFAAEEAAPQETLEEIDIKQDLEHNEAPPEASPEAPPEAPPEPVKPEPKKAKSEPVKQKVVLLGKA